MRTVLTTAGITAALSGCALYSDDDPPGPDPDDGVATYRLEPRGNITTTGNIVGVTWDGTQHWLVTSDEVGDYTVPDVVKVFAFDAETGARSNEITLTDHADRPLGAAWVDGEIWINYTLSGDVVSLDPATGIETPRFTVGSSIYEIDSDGSFLYVADSSVSGRVDVRDLVTGSIVDVRWTEEWQASLRGVAVVKPPGASEHELWGGTLANTTVPVMVGDEVVARATFEGFNHNMAAAFTFADQRLTMLMDNQLYFFDVIRP